MTPRALRRCLFVAALLSPTVAMAQAALPGSAEMPRSGSWIDRRFSLRGYLRTRFDLFENLDLDRGPTPTTGQPIFFIPPSGAGPLTTANMRLRLEPSLRLGWGASVHARIDILDNLVLGSTPEGLPASVWAPMSAASARTSPPRAGENAEVNSLRVKRVWGEVILPIGVITAGRMGALIDWGTGFFINSGSCLDCDLGDEGDRVALSLPLLGHLLLLAFDFGASGPTSSTRVPRPQPVDLDPRDNVRSYALAIARYDTPRVVERYRRAGRTVVQYGLLTSLRTQRYDVPAYYLTGDRNRSYDAADLVRRDLLAFAADVWFGLRMGRWTVDVEGAALLSQIGNASMLPGTTLAQRITARQFGAVGRMRYRWPAIDLEFEVGLASGDNAPGFGVRTPINQLEAQPGDLEGPQFRIPGDTTINNFRFNPDYRVDLILWRRIIGAISNAVYLRPSAIWRPLRGLQLRAALITSLALEPSSTPSGERPLGVEANLGARYTLDSGFEARLSYGVLFPLSGLNNNSLGLSAKPAQTLHAILAFLL